MHRRRFLCLAAVAVVAFSTASTAAVEADDCRQRFARGLAHFNQKRLVAAESDLVAYVRCVKGDPKGWNTLGAIRLQRGDAAMAEKLFRRAVKLAPSEPKYRYNLGVSLFRQERYLESARIIGRVYSEHPSYFFDRTDRDKALDVLEQERQSSSDPLLDRAYRWFAENGTNATAPATTEPAPPRITDD